VSLVLDLALIPATWALALALVRPVAERTTGVWPLPLILMLGCSGSVYAVAFA
jgi:hypothetical protein